MIAPQIVRRGIGGGFILGNLARQVEGNAWKFKRNSLLSFLDSAGFSVANIRSGKWSNFIPMLPQQQAQYQLPILPQQQPIQTANSDTLKILSEIQLLAVILKLLDRIV